jgi:homoserine dehydrogenase
MFYGAGAGGMPTASAVLGDLVAVCRNKVGNGPGPTVAGYADLRVNSMGQARTRYHVSLDVDDKAGVLAQVATVFAEHDVSIQTVRQSGRGLDARLVVATHSATDADLAATVESVRALDTVRDVASVMRVEGD